MKAILFTLMLSFLTVGCGHKQSKTTAKQPERNTASGWSSDDGNFDSTSKQNKAPVKKKKSSRKRK